jgi:septal ring factor EnvC (AmiA/AmiB activator)
MKPTIGIIVLAVLAAGLVVGLIVIKKQADDQHERDISALLDSSNQLYQANTSLNDLRQVNLTLNSDLATNRLVLADLSNNLESVSQAVTNIQVALSAAQDQLAGQSNRIADLQSQNQVLNDRAALLTQQAVGLTNTINSLNAQITDTMAQLTVSQTNNAFLEQQLQQLVEMKAELEHKFNSLEDVRDQVKKLHDEIIEARRLRWMKEGTDVQLKGAELLTKWRNTPSGPTAPGGSSGTNYSLNVVIGSDGSVHALPPSTWLSTNSVTTNGPAASPATNAPATTNAPAQ